MEINIGDIFGRWKIIAFDEEKSKEKGRRYYICECQCGSGIIKSIAKYSLTSGASTSCGCYNKEQVSKTHKKHGAYCSSLYCVWENMKQRCLNKNHPSYKNYGERGIKICKEWMDNYIKFENWALENGYSKNLTIDRIDNDKDYCPENCRFIPFIENQNNKRTNTYLEFNGEMHTIAEWARKLNINTRTLVTRLDTLGWSIEKALSTPAKKYKNRKENVDV